MPSSDYAAVTGGALKLKGSNVTKKKKKKPKQPAAEDDTTVPTTPNGVADGVPPKDETNADQISISKTLREEEDSLRQEIETELKQSGRPKTEAEKRFEEQRRKRLEERLKRDGVKTHKERVEELNRYLSKLSEHHDMYALSMIFILIQRKTDYVSGRELARANAAISSISYREGNRCGRQELMDTTSE
jgi:protein FAM32A